MNHTSLHDLPINIQKVSQITTEYRLISLFLYSFNNMVFLLHKYHMIHRIETYYNCFTIITFVTYNQLTFNTVLMYSPTFLFLLHGPPLPTPPT